MLPQELVASICCALAVSSQVQGDGLTGFKGNRLKGSISCVHPNIVHDLVGRIGEADNYSSVLHLYLQQGYCVAANIPTMLRKPLANRTFRTFDGHDAELWETTLRLDHGDGTSEVVDAYSIVFPREMEITNRD